MRVLLFLLAMMLVPFAAAVHDESPSWSPEQTVLYIDSNDAANGDAENTGFLSTIKDHGDDAALGPSGTCATHSGTDLDFTVVPPATTVDLLHTMPLQPAQPGTAVIKSPVQAKLYVGSGGCYGEVDITARLVAGGATIAEGGVTEHRYNDASAFYPLADFELTVNQAEFEADDLRLEIHITGKTGGSVFLGIGSSRGFSEIQVPLESFEARQETGPAPTYVDLDGALDLPLLFNATTGTTIYNWTAPNGSLAYTAAGNLTGNVTVTISDGTVFSNHTFSGLADVNETLTGPGNWTITVQATDASGPLALRIVPVPSGTTPDGSAGSGGDGTDNGAGGSGNETEDPAGAPDAGKESPGLGFIVLPLLGLIAYFRRR